MSIGPDPDPRDDTPGMHLWGWMAPAELRWLMAQAERMRTVVEVGSLHGRSGFALGTAARGPVVCVDLWDDPHGKSMPSFLGATSELPNVYAVQGRSPDVVPYVLELLEPVTSLYADAPGVDMVFLDGAHDAASVRADVEGWLPVTQRLICGHDYGHASWDVQEVVDEVFGDRVRVAPETSIWYVELPVLA